MNTIFYALKDLKAQKVRSFMGIIGVAVSIFLLSTVSFLTDSVSAAYVDYLTTDAGDIDYNIYQRYVSGGQHNEEYWFKYNDMSEQIASATDDIEGYIPRVIAQYSANYSGNSYTYFNFIGLNVSYERDIAFGSIVQTDYDFEQNGIPKGNCAISFELAASTGLRTGDTLNITRWRDNSKPVPGYYMNLTICAVFTPRLKFPAYMDSIVLVDIQDIPYLFGISGDDGNYFIGRCNNLYLTLKSSAYYYDVRDIKGSETKVMNIGNAIQYAIGYGYWIDMPKLASLGYAQYISVGTSIIFIFIGLISMLIAAILINGILSTSVEERIREFGIFRCLGAHKSFNLKLVVIQGLLLCLLGTTVGVLGSMVFVSKVFIPLAMEYIPEGYITGDIPFVAQPTSILTSYLIGIIVSMLVSIAPALKVARIEIVQSINPYRHDEVIWKLGKTQTVNYKILLFGVLLSVNGGIIFFIIPRLMASMNMTLIASLLIIILLVFLIGLTMAGVGLMPILLRLWVAVFTPFFRKVMNVINVSIYRHQRRNNSTVLMFCLSFSFVMFTSSMINIQMSQVSAMIELERGSPLVLYRSGTGLQTPTVDMQQELMQVDGIERTSMVIANPSQLTQMYSEDGKIFDAEIGDYIYLKSSSITLFGIDNNYLDTVFTQYIQFSQGQVSTAFEKLYNGSNTCIISESLRSTLAVNINDKVRLTFIRGEETSFEEFIIVGVAGKLTGFTQFKSSGFLGSGDGVVISTENYIKYMDIPQPAWVYKVFINLRDNKLDRSGSVARDISNTLSENWDFYVIDVAGNIDDMKGTFFLVELILTAILSFTIVICMFGLFASSYASILERKREIAILRALGLKREGVGNLFTIESMIIMLASGSTGTIVGFITAMLLSENMTLFTESPRLVTFPWASTLILFAISTIVLLFGMGFLLRRVKKQNLIEIFRETT
jgi:ABC-type antimicrobial peptide transport system permease subunit